MIHVVTRECIRDPRRNLIAEVVWFINIDIAKNRGLTILRAPVTLRSRLFDTQTENQDTCGGSRRVVNGIVF